MIDKRKQDLKNILINKIIDIEGGYVDDPDDSGGETIFGITKDVARDYGYQGSMKDMPLDLAREIYADKYWHSLELDNVYDVVGNEVTYRLFDIGVNMGTGRAGRFLQRSLNVLNEREQLWSDIAVDGVVGPNTIDKLIKYKQHRGSEGKAVLEMMLRSLQGAKYVNLAERREKDEKFVYGWFLKRILE